MKYFDKEFVDLPVANSVIINILCRTLRHQSAAAESLKLFSSFDKASLFKDTSPNNEATSFS